MKGLTHDFTTPLMDIHLADIQVQSVGAGVLAQYQKKMSKAIWRPAFGRKMGFLVTQYEHLLGLIFLATPVMCVSKVVAPHLFPGMTRSEIGIESRHYMDLSVCVAAQPVGWHWNLGKLMALIAPTLGDYVLRKYGDDLKGILTTSLWGGESLGRWKKNSTQYSKIYEYLGESKGFGTAHISDERYAEMMAYLRGHCPHCTPRCEGPIAPEPTRTQKVDATPCSEWCVIPGCKWRKGCGDGSSPKMRRIAKYLKVTDTPKSVLSLTHGQLRGVYYHPAVPPEQRAAVIQNWYERWGLPRYLRMKDQQPPYVNGLEGGKAKQAQI